MQPGRRAVVGILLAAGAGRRLGQPKALLRDAAGTTLLDRGVGALLDGGCAAVVVVLGAEATTAEALLAGGVWATDPRVHPVTATDWADGMRASLTAGLTAAAVVEPEAVAAVVLLVDLPGVGSAAVHRLADTATTTTLARATYAGQPGHPVVIGRDHWAALTRPDTIGSTRDPDHGALDHLATHATALVPCDDVADGSDVDHPVDARRHGLV